MKRPNRRPGARGRGTRLLPLLLLLPALLALAACGDAAERRGGTVVIGSATDIDVANPLVSVDAWTNEILRYVLFTPLVRYGPELGFAPALAESWEMTGDTAVVFHLREDLRWHDGIRTTAHDVLFTYERAKDPATGFPNADYFSLWTGGEVVDSFTVRFSLEPHAEPLAGWPFIPIVPKHLLDTIPAEAMRRAPFNQAPVGNGPFRFVSRRPGDRWIFEANPDYPAGLGGRPLLDRLVWRVIPENAAQLTELRVGEVDLALHPTPGEVRALAERPNLKAVVKPSRQFRFVVWNGRRPPLDDPRVRRALAMAVDRGRILDGLQSGLGEIGTGPIMPFHWSYDPALEPLPFDPDSARAILAAAGVRDRDGDEVLEYGGDDFAVEIKIPANNDLSRDMAEAIRSDLERLGVAATTRALELGTLFSDVTSAERDFDAALLGWSGDLRVDLRDTFHSRSMEGPYQFASYANPRLDSLMDRAVRETDRERAAPLWREVQRVLLEEQPWTVLYYQTDAFLARERLRGLDMDIRGGLVHVTNWWLAGDQTEPADEVGD
jgi:peptide/nickel transport system substrate-binding protein